MNDGKPLTFMGLLEAVFGKVRLDKYREPSKTRRRCHRCGGRFDATKAKARPPFCSQECSESIPSTRSVSTRQGLRHGFRTQAKRQVAQMMGVGPKAMNPRRERRRVMLSMAKNLYREAKG